MIASDGGAREADESDLPRARQVLEQVIDPEVPVVSVVDLGIVREVDWHDGHLRGGRDPDLLRLPGHRADRKRDQPGRWSRPASTRASSGAWRRPGPPTGSAPRAASACASSASPRRRAAASKRSLLGETDTVCCPQCGSQDTEVVSQFGSTACKALYRCRSCLEPFDYFKCI